MTRATPQPGIFAVGTPVHRHLEFAVDGAPDAVAAALCSLAGVDKDHVNANVVVGMGDALAQRLFGDAAPAVEALPDLPEVPHTPRDLWVWLHGFDRGEIYDAGRETIRCLAGVASVEHDVDGFVYQDNRDLTGFVDGSANPTAAAAAAGEATIAAGRPGAGGSFAITQTWEHELDAFEALPVEEQERVFGRTKADSVELTGAAKPDDAHNARMEIEEDGEELSVFRRSIPHAAGTTAGLHFVGFARRGDIFPRMVNRMFGAEDGIRDRLISFTRPVTGTTWFVPPVELLDQMG